MTHLHAGSVTRLRRIATGIAGAAVLATLASCGGSDDGTPPAVPVATNQPPATASASVDGFIAYLKVLVATAPDTTEPLDVTTFVAPVSDTGSPDPSI